MKRLLQYIIISTLLALFSTSISLAQRWQIVGVPIVFKAEVSTMSADEVFESSDALFFVKNPGGASRNFNPSGAFIAGTAIFLVNSADAAENVIFDSAGIAKVIHQNECGIFVYSGSVWKVVYAGAAEIKEDNTLNIAGVLLKGSDRYLNFNTTMGGGGYGLRDFAGAIQYKNSGGEWANIPTGAGGGNVTYIEEGDAARVDSSAADVYLDFDDADFDVSVIGNEGNVTVNDSAIDHDATANYVASEHIDHSSVTLTAGAGLSGGGDITSNRSFAFDGTEINSVTWGDGTLSTIPFTFNLIAGDPTITAGNAQVTIDTTVGIGTTGPDRKLDVLDAANPQLRLTYTDATQYTDFQTDASGDITITPSGGDAILVGNLGVNETTPATTLDVNGSAILTGSARYLNFNTTTGPAGYGVRDYSGTMQFKDSTGGWTNFSVAAGDDISLTKSDASAAPQTVNLPTAVGKSEDLYIVVKTDSSANAVTIDPNGAETIDGASKYILRRQYETVAVVSDNANWFTASRNGQIVNVQDFGATGDGATNDTTAIQNAINAAQEGDCVFFPVGDYWINAALTVTKRLWLLGAGLHTQIFQSADLDLFQMTNWHGSRMENLCLGSAATTAGKSLLLMTNCSYSVISHVYMKGGYYGIYLKGCLGTQMYNPTSISGAFFENTSTNNTWIYGERYNSMSINHTDIFGVLLQQGTNGIKITDTNNEGGVLIHGSLIEGLTGAGLYLSGIKEFISLEGLHFEANTSGITLFNCGNGSIRNCPTFTTAAINIFASNQIEIAGGIQGNIIVDEYSKNITIKNLQMTNGANISAGPHCTIYGIEDADDTVWSGTQHQALPTVGGRNMCDGSLDRWAGGVPVGFSTYPNACVSQESTIVKFGTYSARVTVQAASTVAALEFDLDFARMAKPFLKNRRSADYKWTQSPADTNSYYCELAAGGDPGIKYKPRAVYINNSPATEGTLPLANGQWDYGNFDTLGYSTIYVRTAGTTDPDAEASGYVQSQYKLQPITVRAWAYKPAANGINPAIHIAYPGSSTSAGPYSIPTDQWTPITATFNLSPNAASASVRFYTRASGGTPGDVCLFDGIEIVEGTTLSPILDESRGIIGNFGVSGNILRGGEVGTMAGNETFDYGDGNWFIKNPGGASRNLNPSGAFPEGTEITVINKADAAENIVFDSGTLACPVRQNQRAVFVYDGAAWQIQNVTNTQGDKQQFSFMQSNVAASQTAVALDVLGLSGNTEYTMPYPGSIVGISVASNAARTAGTLTVDATVNGTVTGLQAVLDGSNTTYHSATQARSSDTFTANQRVGVKITTAGDWAPTTADIVVSVIVEM